jgi:hypothetical protein
VALLDPCSGRVPVRHFFPSTSFRVERYETSPREACWMAESVKARLHGGIFYGTSHGTQLVPQKVRGTSRVNGRLSVRLDEYHGISNGMSHGISHSVNGPLEVGLMIKRPGFECPTGVRLSLAAFNITLHLGAQGVPTSWGLNIRCQGCTRILEPQYTGPRVYPHH